MAKKRKNKSLGIVPRTLLRGAIAGAIPACALTGCASSTGDGADADRPDVAADTRVFGVDAAAFGAPPDAAFGVLDAAFGVDAAAFSVADLGFHPDRPLFSVALDALPKAPDGGADGPTDAGANNPDANPDHIFFAVDAPSFKG
jgi:hypothetical protein